MRLLSLLSITVAAFSMFTLETSAGYYYTPPVTTTNYYPSYNNSYGYNNYPYYSYEFGYQYETNYKFNPNDKSYSYGTTPGSNVTPTYYNTTPVYNYQQPQYNYQNQYTYPTPVALNIWEILWNNANIRTQTSTLTRGIRIESTTNDLNLRSYIQGLDYTYNIGRDITNGGYLTITKTNTYNGVQIDIVSNDYNGGTNVQNYVNAVVNRYTSTYNNYNQQYTNYSYGTATLYDTRIYRSVVNLYNGVKVTLTANDINMIQSLQANARNYINSNYGTNSYLTIVKVSNGVELTLTSTDIITIRRIQDDVANARY
jgi:hypothetical protein